MAMNLLKVLKAMGESSLLKNGVTPNLLAGLLRGWNKSIPSPRKVSGVAKQNRAAAKKRNVLKNKQAHKGGK